MIAMSPPQILSTNRLRLRQWLSADFPPFAQLNADPRVMEYFPDTLDTQASNALAIRIQTFIAQRGWGFWAVEEITSERFIGFVGLYQPTYALPFGPCVEIGWRLAFDHWGKGYATEAATAALAFGFEHLKLQEVVSFTTLSNRRSRAVMEKIGLHDSGETFEHPLVPVGHPLRPHCLYRLNALQWQAQGAVSGVDRKSKTPHPISK